MRTKQNTNYFKTSLKDQYIDDWEKLQKASNGLMTEWVFFLFFDVLRPELSYNAFSEHVEIITDPKPIIKNLNFSHMRFTFSTFLNTSLNNIFSSDIKIIL